MTLQVTGLAKKDFKKLDGKLQKKVLKQFAFLKADLRHPSSMPKSSQSEARMYGKGG